MRTGRQMQRPRSSSACCGRQVVTRRCGTICGIDGAPTQSRERARQRGASRSRWAASTSPLPGRQRRRHRRSLTLRRRCRRAADGGGGGAVGGGGHARQEVDHARALDGSDVPRARLDLGRVVVLNFTPRVELDPLAHVLERVGMLLKERDRVAVVREWNRPLPLRRAVHLVSKLCAPLRKVARLVVQDHTVAHWNRIRRAAEAVRAVELNGGQRASDGLAVHVREHSPLRECVDMLEEIDRLRRGRDCLKV
mmetsp:Transcript_19849/g.61752  ORF Transcript_19849/g.61752 Transcript_19849/m.61752 type:complete len:252 (-) Transcript_19849:843-1598(-)